MTESTKSHSFVEHMGLWIGVISAAITTAMTVWNVYTKNQIDKKEEDLKQLEITLKSRSTGVEESKERVERYKWVLSLLPSLIDQDQTKRNFTVSLVRLALTKEEGEQLFAGLQLSTNPELREAGQRGFESLENQELNRLVLQMNALAADERKEAVARLEKNYSTSPLAISLTLERYQLDRIRSLSPSGVINGIYFLASTDSQAWTPQYKKSAEQLIYRLRATGTGPQTGEALNKLEKLVNSLNWPE
ncbi:MAG: hypothetical protein E6Q61_00515 [Nitrosomonas sp.]|nr:MAG: hypothetical protein E6Q61_00515 [Nitrosomonas sp.]